VDRTLLKARFREVFKREAFPWQLDEAVAVLEGRDVILDVGTGSGKTFCAALPLLLHEDDVGIVISPISALMIDQVGIYSICVC
jgi:superfamily II DNA helicase RecQ